LSAAAALGVVAVGLGVTLIRGVRRDADARAVGLARSTGGLTVVAAGAGMVGAYVLTLAALRLAAAAPVAAVRETSVLIAVLAAAALGRERIGALRLTAAVAVTAGTAAIALG